MSVEKFLLDCHILGQIPRTNQLEGQRRGLDHSGLPRGSFSGRCHLEDHQRWRGGCCLRRGLQPQTRETFEWLYDGCDVEITHSHH